MAARPTRKGSGSYALTVLATAMVLLFGCATPPTTPRSDATPPDRPVPTTRTLRIAAVREPPGMIFGSAGDAVAQTKWLFHVSLTTWDAQGNLLPLVAQKIPSLDDGDWKLLPDGGMELTWQLRPNVKWHDGTPLAAEDFVFGMQAAKDSSLEVASGAIGMIREVVAPDSATVVFRWSKPYYDANVGTPPSITALPRHLLADLYQQGDPKAFLNSPYWTSDFVGLGPYRLTDWTLGSHTAGVAFDEYFLGRPKIDRVIVRYILDPNAVVAALFSGDIDMFSPSTLKLDDAQPIIQAWGPQDGKVILSMVSIVSARLQFRDPGAPWVRDPRARRALLHLLDRQAMSDSFEGNPEGGPADVWIARSDPVFRLVEQRGYARYPYDLAAADRLLTEAGWSKGSDGIFRNPTGDRFRIDATTQQATQVSVRYALALQDGWRQGGLESETEVFAASATNANELQSKAQGIYIHVLDLNPTLLRNFESARIATAQNSWVGVNTTAYSNPEFDRQNDLFNGTLDIAKRQSVYADLLHWMADEVVSFPLFYAVSGAITAHRAGIRGPTSVSAVSKVGPWNVQEWEMD
jgi:peptide/nickel transport system substrate-binding protein